MESTCFSDIASNIVTHYKWCDENAYRLAAILPDWAKCYVVFISNSERKVNMLYQASEQPITKQDYIAAQKGLCWDYHVIVICWCDDGWIVYDSSTTLGWGIPLHTWIQKSFPTSGYRKSHPLFKIIPRSQYLKDFKSNRTDLDGVPIAPENWPSWPLINQKRGTSESNLAEYADMSGPNPPKGKPITVDQLVQFFYPIE